MKVTLYAATSEDGFIAHPDKSEDFLPDVHWNRFEELARECGNFIIGRTSYELVRDWGDDVNFDNLADLPRVVVTHDPSFSAPGFVVAFSSKDALKKLRSEGHDRALVAGGATLNTSFWKEGLVDEVILSVEPIRIGEGIPVFHDPDAFASLRLISSQQQPDGSEIKRYVP